MSSENLFNTELLEMERIIKVGNYPSLQYLIKAMDKSKGSILLYKQQINDIFHQAYYDELNGQDVLCYSREKKGYYYIDPSYSLKNALDIKSVKNQNLRRKELIDYLKKYVTNPGLKNPNVDSKIKRHIESTNQALDRCKTLQEVIFYYDQALEGLTGKEDVATELEKNGLNCFESPTIRAMVDSYRKYL